MNPEIDIHLKFKTGEENADTPYVRLPGIPPIGAEIITDKGRYRIDCIEIDDSHPKRKVDIYAHVSRLG